MRIHCALVLLAGVVACGSNARAQTTVSFSAVDRGWYNELGFHDSANINYVAGFDLYSLRNFLVFDLGELTLLPSQAITSATLVLDTFQVKTIDPSETYNLYDVSSPIAYIIDGSGGVAAYADLGTGSLLGSRTFTIADAYTVATIPLNAAAIQILNDAAGGTFVIGGDLVTATNLQPHFPSVVFGLSQDAPGIQRLDLVVISEPSAFAVAATSLLALSAIRRRH